MMMMMILLLYRYRHYASARPDWLAETLYSQIVRPSVRSSVRLLHLHYIYIDDKLLNTIL